MTPGTRPPSTIRRGRTPEARAVTTSVKPRSRAGRCGGPDRFDWALDRYSGSTTVRPMKTNTSPATSEATYRAALGTVLATVGPDDARSLRSYALRVLEHCLKEGIDPTLPGAEAFEQFSAELSDGQRWRFAHAARRVLGEVGQPAHVHGLGRGGRSERSRWQSRPDQRTSRVNRLHRPRHSRPIAVPLPRPSRRFRFRAGGAS